MNLVYVLLSPTFGMHQYTADLANRMAEVHAVSLVTMKGYPADRYSPLVNVVASIPIVSTGLSLDGLKVGQLSELVKQIENLEPDLVHITGPHLWNVYLVRRLRSQKIQVIHTIHDLDPHSGTRLPNLLKTWNNLILHSADHILVHGKCYRQRLLQMGIEEHRVSYTPLMFLFLSYQRTKELDIKDIDLCYGPFILFFGRLEKYKGIETLLEAYEIFSKSHTCDDRTQVRLILAGPGKFPQIKNISLSSGVELRNRMIQDNEALELFSNCSLVVLPYSDATQSSLIASAYYFQKPVIVTRTGALPEYVEDAETGFVVEPKNPTHLASAFIQIVSDPGSLRSMGMEGRKWYDNRRLQETQSLFSLYQSFCES